MSDTNQINMNSMQYNYWVSQCQNGFQLLEDEDDYSDLSEETLFMENGLWVYRIEDIIYVFLHPSTYIIN